MGIHERKEREKEHRREEIIKAAQAIFFEKGLQNATMDEIAERAELSKGTLYLYHKSKEDLYLAVMVQGMEILFEMFSKAITEGESAIDSLRRIGETYHEFFHKHRNYFRMFYFFQSPHLHKQVSAEMMECCTLQNQKVWNFVIEILERGTREGLLRRDLSAAETAVILWSCSNAIMARIDCEIDYWKTKLNVDLEEVLAKSNAFLLEAIMTEETKQLHRQGQPATR